MMNDTIRIDELIDDAGQILMIAQEVLNTTRQHTHEAIQERDAEILRLRRRVRELEHQLRDPLLYPWGGELQVTGDMHELNSTQCTLAEPSTSHA